MRTFFIVWMVLAILAVAPVASAHAPFDCSVRTILYSDSAEVVVTVGTSLGEQFLEPAGVPPRSLNTLGTTKILPAEVAVRLFDVREDGQRLTTSQVDVSTDGLEYHFRMVYPLAAAATLQLHPLFLKALKPPQQTALAVTDENGNGFGSAVLSPAREFFQMPLPASLFPPATIAAAHPAIKTGEAANKAAASAILSNAGPMGLQHPIFLEYWLLGLQHILTGYDHLLFLGGLLIACRRVASMIAVITCFTLAHSLTLGLAVMDVVHLSPRVVEPLIAATIICIGLENFRSQVNFKARCGLTLVFGLIHGFGFAGALQATGLAAGGRALAMPLLAFNLGVEGGQLAVVAAFLPVLFWFRNRIWFQAYGTQAVSSLVVALGGFWLVQRVCGF